MKRADALEVLLVCFVEVVFVGLKQCQSGCTLPAKGAVFAGLVAEPFVDPSLRLRAEMHVEVLSHYCFGVLLQFLEMRLGHHPDVVEVEGER